MRFTFSMLAVAAVLATATQSQAAPITITDSRSQFDPNGFNTTSNVPVNITQTGFPFDYAAQPYSSLTSITSLSITLTINDGDTGPGNFDFNNVSLFLDGIDTGIKLNGFNDGQLLTLTITGSPSNAASILAALQVDGQLNATLVTPTNGNFLGTIGKQSTTLAITGEAAATPEPATLATLGLMGAAGFGYIRRRLKGAPVVA